LIRGSLGSEAKIIFTYKNVENAAYAGEKLVKVLKPVAFTMVLFYKFNLQGKKC